MDESATNASYGGVSQQMRVRLAASRVLAQLLGQAGGITVFLAQEILHSLREAIAILSSRRCRRRWARATSGAPSNASTASPIRRATPRCTCSADAPA